MGLFRFLFENFSPRLNVSLVNLRLITDNPIENQ